MPKDTKEMRSAALCRTVSPEVLERVVVPSSDTILRALGRSSELFHAAADAKHSPPDATKRLDRV